MTASPLPPLLMELFMWFFLQDTAGGNDTSNVTAMTAATMIDMAGGTTTSLLLTS